MTNADRIRAMSDEGLAEFMDLNQCVHCNYESECHNGLYSDCIGGYLEWLQSEVKESK